MKIQLPAVAAAPLLYVGAGLTILAVVWGLWWFILIRPGDMEVKAAKAGVDSTFAQARTEAAQDATAITAGADQAAAADETTTRKNRDEILAQPGAQAPVDPHVADAGRRAICLRHAARCSDPCVRMLGPCPR